MKHYGDITKISGYDLPIVDVITGGSPCQDLSVAGAKAGLSGSRSKLFLEQIRIIKEMRERDRQNGRSDEFVRPRIAIWENVPGALSSGKPKGADFQIVLQKFAEIADENAVIPRLKDGERWSNSGCIMGTGWSIAWRVHDGQFWGVTQELDGRMLTRGTPQRRKRIALVADFNGYCAPEVLFVRKGLSRDFNQSGKTGQGTAGDSEDGTGESDSSG